MIATLPEIDENQRAVIERVYETFRSSATWPSFGQLDIEFDRRGFDLVEILRTIPIPFARFDRSQLSYPQRGMMLELNVFGIAMCDDSAEDLDLFFEVLHWLAGIERNQAVDSLISSNSGPVGTDKSLREYLSSIERQPSLINIRKMGMLLQSEPPGIREGFSTLDGGWTIFLARGIRDYREVKNIHDYLSIIFEKAPEYFGLNKKVEVIDLVEQINSWTLIPGVIPKINNEVVLRAMLDAENLIQTSGPTSAVDRVHTILHGYLRAVCVSEGILYSQSDTMVALLKKIRSAHPRLTNLGFRAQDLNKVLNSCASILDALLPVRNQASVAHPNEVLIGESEARLVINVGRTLLDYLNCKLS